MVPPLRRDETAAPDLTPGTLRLGKSQHALSDVSLCDDVSQQWTVQPTEYLLASYSAWPWPCWFAAKFGWT